MVAWPIIVAPAEDELLSGWLCRVAFAHGATPYGLCALYLNDRSVWARDMDRGSIARHLEALSALSRVDDAQLRGMTLMPWIGKLSAGYASPDRATITPWISAAGIFHRKRRRHALSYCPECLAATGTVCKHWRLAFLVVCERHGIPLQDGCPRCDAPFVPHRSLCEVQTCHDCGYRNLARSRSKPAIPKANWIDDIAGLQQRMLAILESARPAVEHPGCSLEDLRTIVSVLLAPPFATITMNSLGCEATCGAPFALRMEFARIGERTDAMRVCCALLATWPTSFRWVAGKLALTQRPFARLAYSRWLSEEVERLPPGIIHSCRAARSSLASQVARVHKIRPQNWHAERARLMMRDRRTSR